MIRLIRMDRQVVDLPGHREFALWDTATDRFVEIDGDWSWECVQDLDQSLNRQLAARMRGPIAGLTGFADRRARLLSLASSVPEYLQPPSSSDD